MSDINEFNKKFFSPQSREEQQINSNKHFSIKHLEELSKALGQPIKVPPNEDPVCYFNDVVMYRYWVEARKLNASMSRILKWNSNNPLGLAFEEAHENSGGKPVIFITKTSANVVWVAIEADNMPWLPSGSSCISIRVNKDWPFTNLWLFKWNLFLSLVREKLTFVD